MEHILVSTVTPVYRGEATLPELVRRLDDVRHAWEISGLPIALTESIFVDDGSIDGSAEILEQLADSRPWVQVVTLSKNFGQHPATVAGILHTCGDWVATLDEDIQHEPGHLQSLLEHAVAQRLDIVYAKPEEPVHGSVFRDGSSRLLKRWLGAATGNRHVRSFNSFRMMRGSIARAAGSVSSHDSYFDIVLCWFSDRVGALSLPMVDHRYQAEGKSGYNLWKLLSHARRLLFSSQTKWLRAGALVGLGALALSAVLFVVTFVQKIIDPASVPVRGWTSLFLAILFFGGLSSFLLGTLFEYVSTLVLKSHGKPTLFVVNRSKDAVLRGPLPRLDSDAAPRSEPAES